MNGENKKDSSSKVMLRVRLCLLRVYRRIRENRLKIENKKQSFTLKIVIQSIIF